MYFDKLNLKWINVPNEILTDDDLIELTTDPKTDLWQRTYYRFRNDNAHMVLAQTDDKYFSFSVKTNFGSAAHRFDQCGIIVYLDSENWLKCSVEYENSDFQYLGSVATNNGYSDWATSKIPADIKTVWYRLSRRESDFCIEYSPDGGEYSQMRVCHMFKGGGKINFGIYACSPEESSFRARFTNMRVTECMWKAHDGQPPDEEA